MLSIKNLHASVEEKNIIKGLNLEVKPGEVHAIMGPNGAGKSTAMKAVFGMLSLREGKVLMDGVDITALKPQERVRQGMGFVPQTNNVFTSLTVEENLEMGAFIRRDDFSDTMAQVFDLFPVLKESAVSWPENFPVASVSRWRLVVP